ncbi:MAG: MotA/TolQ/ExbB proton channel family protein [Planctomycetaceae bacterium]|jgi:biopolymer transport protein ExbB/TolQ|nr:MotA/TolQ/ExbB proton channel family protein [Planctomycetaceae bacterium]
MTDALTFLSNAFYMISNALLIPVMLGLLFGLLVSLLTFGRMLREMLERLAFRMEKQEYTTSLENNASELPPLSAKGQMLAAALEKLKLKTDDPLSIGKLAADTESYWQAELEKLQTWCRIGPALGLMGTLIPLGPGLVALADGDLKTLSNNLIIAFATTVVGILIGLISGSVHGIRKRWYRDDSLLLTFAAERFSERNLRRCDAQSLTTFASERPAEQGEEKEKKSC